MRGTAPKRTIFAVFIHPNAALRRAECLVSLAVFVIRPNRRTEHFAFRRNEVLVGAFKGSALMIARNALD